MVTCELVGEEVEGFQGLEARGPDGGHRACRMGAAG